MNSIFIIPDIIIVYGTIDEIWISKSLAVTTILSIHLKKIQDNNKNQIDLSENEAYKNVKEM